MRRILGRAAALALIAGLCATVATAGADLRAHRAPALTLPAHADGLSRALASGRISPAREALLRAQALFHAARVAAAYGPIAHSGGEATMILRDLAVRLGGLAPGDRKIAHAILARPSDSDDPQGDAWNVPEAAGSPDCGPNVCIHWASGTGGDAPAATDTTPANGIPDYVDQALDTAENVWNQEVGTMGYRAPLSDATSTNHGPDGRLDIYLTNLGPKFLYGYCTSDDPKLATLGDPGVTWDVSAYCVVDNNYTESVFRNHTPIQNLKVTLAHEFFHAVQFSYDVGEDTWLMEGTATWMEDQVYDGINDNRQYLQNSQLKYPWIPLDHSANCCFQYGSWIWFRFLSETIGPGVIQEIWNEADAAAGGPDDYSTQAIRQVLSDHHTTFRKKFASFAVWNKISRQRYSEGKAGRYPTPVGSGSFALGAAHTSTGWLAVKLKHMSSIYVTFRPGSRDGPRAHLTVQFDGPRHGFGPEGRLMVFSRSGAVAVKAFKLNRSGDGSLRVGFGRGHVSRVVLIETNASTRFTCWRKSQYSCMGAPLDDGRVYAFRARIP
jgi:Family of unknown function (DUF6055)